MNVKAYALLLIAIVIGVAGQLLLKYGMSRRPAFRLTDLVTLTRNFPVVGGFCCYGIATLLYLTVLRSLTLSVAYPTVSLGYVFIIPLSRKCFNERVSRARWAAVLLICLGVALVGFGAG